MEPDTTLTLAYPLRRLTGAIVVADVRSYVWRHNRTPEQQVADLVAVVKTINREFTHPPEEPDFSGISLDVEEQFETVCSLCKREWDACYDNDTGLFCGNCGAYATSSPPAK